MRKLYYEYFHVPKDGKIRDKVMLVRTAVTTVVMIACLVVMSLTAYAYFSSSVTSGSNIIQAANFEVNVSIDDDAVQIKKIDSKTYTAELEAGKTYAVTLKHAGTAKTGFCIITAKGCDSKYHTQQLGTDTNATNGGRNSIAFKLTVTSSTTVTFYAHWGTSTYYGYENTASDYYITADNDEVTMNVTAPTDSTETIGEPASGEVIHTVLVGENLTGIAQKYNTTVDRIAAYNNIADPNLIETDQKLKIPPADWQMSADTTAQTTAATQPEETTALPETTAAESETHG